MLNNQALNSAALNGTAGGPSHAIADIYDISDAFDASQEISLFRDSLALTSIFYRILVEHTYELEDDLEFSDTIHKIIIYALSDLLTLSDTVSIGTLIETIADALGLSDEFAALITKEFVISHSLALSDAYDIRYRFEQADILALADEIAWKIKVIQTLTDILTLSDTNSMTLTVEESIADSFGINDSLAWIITQTLSISDIFALAGKIEIDGAEYTVWAFNPRTLGPYKLKYLQNINSFARIAGKNLICSDEGIYEVGGDDDNGTLFDAFVKTGFLDFDDPERHHKGEHLKQLLNGYLVMTAEGETLMKVTTTRRGTAKETWFKCKRTHEAMSKHQVNLSNSLRSVLFQFEIKPLEKKPMKLKEIEVIPLFLNRSI